jgi:WD40 repeat protein
VRVWDIRERTCVRTFEEHADRVPWVCFSPDGRWLASAGVDGQIILHRIETGAAMPLCSGGPPVRVLCFAHDSGTLFSGNDEGVIQKWSLAEWKEQARWSAHLYRLFALALHPTGESLASGGVDGDIKLRDPRDGTLLATLTGHRHMVLSLSFHPDGRSLASGGSDEKVFLWDLTYYDRHIAGNLEYQLGRLQSESLDVERVAQLRAWVAEVHARPGAHASGPWEPDPAVTSGGGP